MKFKSSFNNRLKEGFLYSPKIPAFPMSRKRAKIRGENTESEFFWRQTLQARPIFPNLKNTFSILSKF